MIGLLPAEPRFASRGVATAMLSAADPSFAIPLAPTPAFHDPSMPRTHALQGALPHIRDHTARSDLLFLERWEMAPDGATAQVLRVQQIRRANPELAAAIRREVGALSQG